MVVEGVCWISVLIQLLIRVAVLGFWCSGKTGSRLEYGKDSEDGAG